MSAPRPGAATPGAGGLAWCAAPLGAALEILPTPWPRALSAAGVTDDRLRGDYTAAARRVARRYPGLYPLTRLVIPPAWQPYYFAAAAFAVHADCLVDLPLGHRDRGRIHAWAGQVRGALTTGQAEQAFLRAFLHTVQSRHVRHRDVFAYLAGQAERQSITGYATEQDHEDHIDRVLMPFARIAHALTHAEADPMPASVVRPVTDAVQRVDDLADLAADLRRGILTIPETDLLRFGVTRTDLEQGRDLPAVRALLAHACGKARAAAHRALDALPGADAATQVLYWMWLMGCQVTLSGAERQGAALTHRGVLWQVRPSPGQLIDGIAHTLRNRLLIASRH